MIIEEENRNDYAVWIIQDMIKRLDERIEELNREVDFSETNFDTGLMTGYRHAKEMLINRAKGFVIPDPDGDDDELDDEFDDELDDEFDDID